MIGWVISFTTAEPTRAAFSSISMNASRNISVKPVVAAIALSPTRTSEIEPIARANSSICLLTSVPMLNISTRKPLISGALFSKAVAIPCARFAPMLRPILTQVPAIAPNISEKAK